MKRIFFLSMVFLSQICLGSIETAIKNSDVLATAELLSNTTYSKEQMVNFKKLAEEQIKVLESQKIINSNKSKLRLGLGSLSAALGGYVIYESINMYCKDENHRIRHYIWAGASKIVRNYGWETAGRFINDKFRRNFFVGTGSLLGSVLMGLGGFQIYKGIKQVDDKKSLENAKEILSLLNKVEIH